MKTHDWNICMAGSKNTNRDKCMKEEVAIMHTFLKSIYSFLTARALREIFSIVTNIKVISILEAA
jgi:hypothetical protein